VTQALAKPTRRTKAKNKTITRSKATPRTQSSIAARLKADSDAGGALAADEPINESALLKKAASGDGRAALRLFEEWQKTPETARHMVDMLGDMSITAERTLICHITKDDPLGMVALAHKMDQMRLELAGPNPTPLEQQLVRRITLCWLQVNYLEALLANNMEEPLVVEHYSKRIEVAHRRHLSAIKALAQVRRLQLPSLQVNIADKQVNVGQMNHTSPDPLGG
jgi:hypothetical protein